MENEENKTPAAGPSAGADVQGLIDGLKQKGLSEDDIVGTAYLMFGDGQIGKPELEAILDSAGYALPDEIAGISEEELRAKLKEETPIDEMLGDGNAPAPAPGKPGVPTPTPKPNPAAPSEDDKRKAAFGLAFDKPSGDKNPFR